MTMVERITDRTHIPNDMPLVIPPKDTTLYVCAIEDETPIFRFGVREIRQGLIRTFAENVGDNPAFAEGMLISYDPGDIHAHVARCNLTSDEINTIGEISSEMNNLILILSYLPDVIKRTQSVLSDLSILQACKSDMQNEETIIQELSMGVANVGVVLDKLMQNRPEQQKRFHALIEKADTLGITLIESKLGYSSGQIPVALIAKAGKFFAEKTN